MSKKSLVLIFLGAVTTVPCYATAQTADETYLETVTVTSETEQNPQQAIRSNLITNDASVGKTDVPITEQTRSVSVVTQQRMKDMGATSAVQDAFMYTSGVYGAPYGDDTRGDWAKVRGVNPTLYIDGLKASFGYYNNARPNASSIDQIEIFKGPSAVEYGQGGLGGIINLQSKLPQAKKFTEISAEYGSFDHKRLGVDTTGKIDDEGRWLYRFSGSFQDADHQTNYVENNQIALNPSLMWKMDNKTAFTLLANFQENNSGSGTQFLPHQGTIFPAPNGSIPWDFFMSEPSWDKYDTSQRSVTVKGEHNFNSQWTLQGSARYMHGEAEYNTMYPVFPPTINPDGRTINRYTDASESEIDSLTSDIRVKGNFNTGAISHKLAVGLDIQDAKTDSRGYFGDGGSIDLYNPVYGQFNPQVTFTDYPYTRYEQQGLYLNDQLKLDKWILSLGMRYDQARSKTEGATGQKDTAFTKTAGLMYQFDNGLSPYISYAESFEPIIATNAYGKTYDPVEGDQYEIGLKYQPKGTKALITGSVFQMTERNRLSSDPFNPMNNTQTGQAEINGAELEGQFAWNDFDFLATYTHLDTKITKSNNGDIGFNLSDVPDDMASLWVTYRPSTFWKGFKIGAGVRYVGGSWDGADAIRRNDYTLADAMIGYESAEGWDFTLNAHNITDQKYVTSCLARGDCFLGQEPRVVANITRRF